MGRNFCPQGAPLKARAARKFFLLSIYFRIPTVISINRRAIDCNILKWSGGFRSFNCNTINRAAFPCNILNWSSGFRSLNCNANNRAAFDCNILNGSDDFRSLKCITINRLTFDCKVSSDLVFFVASIVMSSLFWPSTVIYSTDLVICVASIVKLQYILMGAYSVILTNYLMSFSVI